LSLALRQELEEPAWQLRQDFFQQRLSDWLQKLGVLAADPAPLLVLVQVREFACLPEGLLVRLELFVRLDSGSCLCSSVLICRIYACSSYKLS